MKKRRDLLVMICSQTGARLALGLFLLLPVQAFPAGADSEIPRNNVSTSSPLTITDLRIFVTKYENNDDLYDKEHPPTLKDNISTVRASTSFNVSASFSVYGPPGAQERIYISAVVPEIYKERVIGPYSIYPGDRILSYNHIIDVPYNYSAGGTHLTVNLRITRSTDDTVLCEGDYPLTVIRNAIVSPTRACMSPRLKAVEAALVRQCCNTVDQKLGDSSLEWNSANVGCIPSANEFITIMKRKRPQLVLLHAKGSDDGQKLYFPDGSYLDARRLVDPPRDPAAKPAFYIPNGYLVVNLYNAAAYSQKDMAYALYRCGFGNVAGLVGPNEYTSRIAKTYRKFFTLATQFNMTAQNAWTQTNNWTNSQGWGQVFLGGSGFGWMCLGGGSPPLLRISPAMEHPARSFPAEIPSFTPWRSVEDGALSGKELAAVETAEGVEEVRQLKEEYGTDLATGVVTLPRVYRVSYKLRDIYLYGVDVDKFTGRINYQGELD